jgi:pantoate--beta-alanine ligase
MQGILHDAGITRIDYAVVVDQQTLAAKEYIEVSARALIAAYVGSTRLIDNRSIDLR